MSHVKFELVGTKIPGRQHFYKDGFLEKENTVGCDVDVFISSVPKGIEIQIEFPKGFEADWVQLSDKVKKENWLVPDAQLGPFNQPMQHCGLLLGSTQAGIGLVTDKNEKLTMVVKDIKVVKGVLKALMGVPDKANLPVQYSRRIDTFAKRAMTE